MADDGPDLALQRAVIAHLRADPDLAALVAARIYDAPPQDAQLPFVRLGRLDLQPDRSDGRRDWDIVLAVEAHSRAGAGRVEAARICGAVALALDECEADLAVPGYPLEWCQLTAQDVARGPDGATYIGVAVFAVSLSGGS